MNIEDNYIILNFKTDEKESSDNVYPVPKEPDVDEQDLSSCSKSSKLLTKVLGDSEEILCYDGIRKKIEVTEALCTYLENTYFFVLSCEKY